MPPFGDRCKHRNKEGVNILDTSKVLPGRTSPQMYNVSGFLYIPTNITCSDLWVFLYLSICISNSILLYSTLHTFVCIYSHIFLHHFQITYISYKMLIICKYNKLHINNTNRYFTYYHWYSPDGVTNRTKTSPCIFKQ
jgi:hypothetical protein